MEKLSKKEEIIINLLKQGYSQKEISKELEDNKITSFHSTSTVEKTILDLKKKFGVKTMFQLGYILGRTRK